MYLPASIREGLVRDLDEFLENLSDNPEPEPVVAYLLELLELVGEDQGIDDIKLELESNGNLDASLAESLDEEMSSNYEFEFTGEEIVSLLEQLTELEWDDDEEDLDLDLDDEDGLGEGLEDDLEGFGDEEDEDF